MKFKCPYCGFEISLEYRFAKNMEGNALYTCEQDAGGCDKEFVFNVKWNPVVKTRRIENESPMALVF